MKQQKCGNWKSLFPIFLKTVQRLRYLQNENEQKTSEPELSKGDRKNESFERPLKKRWSKGQTRVMLSTKFSWPATWR